MTERFARIAKMQADIELLLGTRSSREPAAYERDPTHGRPRYVVTMCEQLLPNLRAQGAHSATLQDVLRCDSLAAGHVDYLSKFALYCVELLEKHDREGED